MNTCLFFILFCVNVSCVMAFHRHISDKSHFQNRLKYDDLQLQSININTPLISSNRLSMMDKRSIVKNHIQTFNTASNVVMALVLLDTIYKIQHGSTIELSICPFTFFSDKSMLLKRFFRCINSRKNINIK
jgi:hypothetical protein